MRFVICAYGNSYIGMLLTTLESIASTHRDDSVSVFWQDMEEYKISLISKCYPKFEFNRTDFDLSRNLTHRIALKTLLWEKAMLTLEDSHICFLDGDTLVRKSIHPFFQSEFDITFTDKPEKFPLNTGVMLVKNSLASKKFFTAWKKETLAILKNPEKLKNSTSVSYPYGAPDQMSFYHLISYKQNLRNYHLSIEGDKVLLKAVPCEILNETRSVPINSETAIYHFKGGWRKILVFGDTFTKNRPKKDGFEMYILYLKTFLVGLDKIRSIAEKLKASDFCIRIPPYLQQPLLTERSGIYLPYLIWRRLINFLFIFLKIGKKLVKVFKRREVHSI